MLTKLEAMIVEGFLAEKWKAFLDYAADLGMSEDEAEAAWQKIKDAA